MRATTELARLTVVCALVMPCAAAATPWSGEAFLGAAAPFTTPVSVHQSGFATLSFDAEWSSNSLDQPIYYALRLGRSDAGGGTWTLSLTHLKLHLANRPPEIDAFAISHGYNLLTAGYLWQRLDWHVGAAAGVVVAHPENTVRGRRLSESEGLWSSGYEIAGPAAEGVLGWRRAVAPWLALTLEGRLSLAHARVSVAEGHANVPGVALHGLFGLRFGGPPVSAGPR